MKLVQANGQTISRGNECIMTKYTTEYDEKIAAGVKYQRDNGVSDEAIIARLERLVSAAILTHFKENATEGGLIIKNFHASLGPKVLEKPFSETVNYILEHWNAVGKSVDSIDGDAPTTAYNEKFK